MSRFFTNVVLAGILFVLVAPTWAGAQGRVEERQQLIRRAEALLEAGKVREAEATYRLVVEREPDSWAAHMALGDFYHRELLDCDQAIPHYRYVLEHGPDSADLLKGLHRALSECLEARGRWGDAAEVHERYAALLRGAGQRREALDVAYREAYAHFRLGDYPRAEAELTALLRDQYDNVNAHLYRAHARLFMGRTQHALDDYLEIRDTFHPPFIELHIGVALAEMDRPAEAIEHLEASVTSDGGDPVTHKWLGDAKQEVGRVAEAEQEYRRGLSLEPDPATEATLNNNLAMAIVTRARPGDPTLMEALELARRAVEHSGGRNPAYTDTYAQVFLKLGLMEEAARWAEVSARLAPTSSFYRAQLRRVRRIADGYSATGGTLVVEPWLSE